LKVLTLCGRGKPARRRARGCRHSAGNPAQASDLWLLLPGAGGARALRAGHRGRAADRREGDQKRRSARAV